MFFYLPIFLDEKTNLISKLRLINVVSLLQPFLSRQATLLDETKTAAEGD